MNKIYQWNPRVIVFQCLYCLYAEADQQWLEHELPGYMKLIKVPCTGRINPLFLLNAIQAGADGILICGCMPEKCHYKKGNLAARRQLSAFACFLSYLGMEKKRIHFAWIDMEERGRIQNEVAGIEAVIRALGPSLILTKPQIGLMQ